MRAERFLKEKAKELFSLANVEQILIFNRYIEQPYFYYFTQLPFGKLSNANMLLLRKRKKPIVISNPLEAAIVERFGLEVKKILNRKELVKFLRAKLSEDALGVNYGELSCSAANKLRKELGVKLIDIAKHLEKIREVKSKEELKLIAKSAKLAESILQSIPEFFKKGMTEKQLALTLEIEAKLLGAELAFEPIVAFGKNAAIPHHLASNTEIKNGLLLVDFGVRYKNYCSDICRTFYVGKPRARDVKRYGIVYEAKTIAEKHLKEGVEASEICREVESFLKKHGFKMIHSLGHGIGLQEHDFPQSLSLKSRFTLKENMCFAIEPAIYTAYGGIRIEDDYIIRKNKVRWLSKASAELLTL